MNHAQQKKQKSSAAFASKPVAIKHANSIKTILQAKLKIGAPNDKYEQEADRVADQVMRMPTPAQPSPIYSSPTSNISNIQRKCAGCASEDELIQKKTSGTIPDVTPSINSNIQSLQGKGQPLSKSERNFFEPRFGTDFSQVRLHTDSLAAKTAQSINARAFTLGNNIVFNSGEYTPNSVNGEKLMAHELTHVRQQRSSLNRSQIQRWSYAAGAPPHVDYTVVPPNERSRVNQAMNIVGRIANSRTNFPSCHNFFRDNCPGGTINTLKEVYDRALMWKDTDNTILGSRVAPDNIAYTDLSYGTGRWAIAASMIHEFIHVCGQASHVIGDQAKGQCGSLPDI
jgi:hypothetical protein